MNKSLQSIFKFWNSLPLFQMLFLWLNKTPPKWDPPLSVQEGFDISFWNTNFSPLLNTIGKPIDNILGNTRFLKLVVVRSFCFGLLLSPPLAWIAKNGTIRALEVLSSSLANKTYEWRLYQRWRVKRSDDEGWVVEWSGSLCLRRRLQFPFNIPMTWFEIHLKTHES